MAHYYSPGKIPGYKCIDSFCYQCFLLVEEFERNDYYEGHLAKLDGELVVKFARALLKVREKIIAQDVCHVNPIYRETVREILFGHVATLRRIVDRK